MKLAVLGRDVSRSESPQIHQFIRKQWRLPCDYDRISLPESGFSSEIGHILRKYDGLNVTIPYKRDILPYLRSAEGDARVFGAVNTVVTATRTGYNTDGLGFSCMLSSADVPVRGRRVLVLGAGGAGRSVLYRLAQAGAQVFCYERDGARLGECHAALRCFTPLFVVDGAFDVIVNCTGVGMHETVGKTPEIAYPDGVFPADRALEGCSCAVDLIYERESEFLRVARSMGKRTLAGGSMLFFQAYFSECIFSGRESSNTEADALYRRYREES